MANIAQDSNTDIKQWFQSLFDVQQRTLNGHREKPLHRFRKSAMDRLGNLSFPHRKDEDWKYTNPARILEYRYQESASVSLEESVPDELDVPDLPAFRIVSVNGNFNPELSRIDGLPKGVVVLSMEQALEEEPYHLMVEKEMRKWAEEEKNPFAVLNVAFARHGIFIYVPANVVVEEPVHMVNITTGVNEPMMTTPQRLVIAERSSQITLLESYHAVKTGERSYFTNIFNRIIVKANATVKHFRWQLEGDGAIQVNNTIIDQHRDSHYQALVADLGGRLVRNNLSACLQDQGTATYLHGIFMADGDQHIDNQTFIDHAFPHCFSEELYKGILTDRAKGVFTGKVMVRQDAQKTNAFQQNSTLVLSPFAVMDSKPQLEIFADDVRCSHGATVGQLDENSIFYLRSRGLTKDQAKALLQHAFLKAVLEKIESDVLRTHFDRQLLNKFEKNRESSL